MCGLTGFWSPAGGDAEDMTRIGRRMATTLRARGPDGDGVWADPDTGICLAHRRLEVIDLSDAAEQPMVSRSGRTIIAYNGEVYNFRELRTELEAAGHDFRSHCDTEVVVEACEAWGVEAAVRRFIGMFAFAVWDRQTRRLTLARDRLGIKPLYWGHCRGTLFFGSQLKSFAPHPDWAPQIDRAALAAYFRYAYVPTPLTIWRGVHKLPPGHLLAIDGASEPRPHCYWNLAEIACQGVDAIAENDAVAQLDSLLRDAVSSRLIADVPVGAFLSGGVDSSAVVALMQQVNGRPAKTFTVDFHDRGYSEANDAAAVARHLGTDHTALQVTPEDALSVVDQIPDEYDEPFADSSQIPSLLMSRLTRRHVTVALSGDGGDEVFAGYNRHRFLGAQRHAWLPHGVRALVAKSLTAVPPRGWDRLFDLVPSSRRPRQAGDKLHKLAGVLATDAPAEVYRQLVSCWPRPSQLVADIAEPAGAIDQPLPSRIDDDDLVRAQYLDMATYLPDDILTKVDRASMASSLEVRVPLLDHRIVEFAWRLPRSLKIRRGRGKWLLRQVLGRYVPPALTERPKTGFAVPLDHWLRHELRDWAEDLLAPQALADAAMLAPAPIRECWAEHLSGRRNRAPQLWPVLMFQIWRRRYRV